MRLNELISGFEIFTSNEEKAMLKHLDNVTYLSSFSEREQVVIEQLIRKSLVIKIGTTNPKVIANEF